jgi:molybdopterin/thiamine biosynthesis adenylyltransferase
MLSYDELVSRNGSYISSECQQRIRKTRLLIAGCGVGSNIAEAAVRMGFENFILIDGDNVEAHNLNRQAFVACDVGSPKVHALAHHLRSINPGVTIREHNGWLKPANAAEFVGDSDLIVDAIDLTSLEDIVALHDAARAEEKTVLAVFSIGWGAGAIHFPPSGINFREMMGLPLSGPVKNEIHGRQFAEAILGMLGQMDEETREVMLRSLVRTADGIPCPGHVAVGYSSVASLAATMAVRILNRDFVAAAPQLILSNMSTACRLGGLETPLSVGKT